MSTMSLFRRRNNLPDFVQTYLATTRPARKLPWREVRYCALDIETTGLNPQQDTLVAIGLVEIVAGRVELGTHWYTLVQPPKDTPVVADSIRVHGILQRDLTHAATITQLLPALLERIRGQVLIVHVAAVDIQFLNRILQQHYRIRLRGPAIDTARVAVTLHHAERLHRGYDEALPSLSLRTLSEKNNIPPVLPEHHALNDALTTAQLFLAQATRLEQHGATTLRGLLRAGGCLR
ncbi:MAG: 3*-5* exonuclease [Chloroflexi bacterium AL-W]|nr:3*-5* exonuclease [Chloroflexi bacterium AL-N1]NOK70861.1 3*-5* exonuclease [Chloroflexi bacterium AL-N10]NOK78421.1 3*-5* exonuclease [Chloroflexi bacterium AL-N5]NOK85402.1 3*-5* exonuclease [Chloroflexi bacterium AL-W]NOK92678.1 3*-5* exonuclease [Chloroflexi bacterium AL-N15]